MKILVLSTNTGGGHNAAGNALIEALGELGARAEMADSLAIASEWASRTVSSVYMNVARRTPKVFAASYRAVSRMSLPRVRSVSYAMNLMNIRKLEEYLFVKAPDAIVTTHVFCAQALTHLIKHGKIGVFTAGIMTDYSLTLYWDETLLDAYFLPHADLVPLCIAKGMPASRLVPTGIPVSPALAEPRDIRAAKLAFGLDPDRKHVVVAGGAMGAGKLPKTVRSLDETLPDNVMISVVCGNNAHAREALEGMRNPRVRVMGYVKPLNALLASADALVSKAGGLTSTEAMVLRVPFIALHSIPPIETANAAFFQARGMARFARNDEEAARALIKILYDPNIIEAFLHAQKRHAPPDASRQMAKYIVNAVEKGCVRT